MTLRAEEGEHMVRGIAPRALWAALGFAVRAAAGLGWAWCMGLSVLDLIRSAPPPVWWRWVIHWPTLVLWVGASLLVTLWADPGGRKMASIPLEGITLRERVRWAAFVACFFAAFACATTLWVYVVAATRRAHGVGASVVAAVGELVLTVGGFYLLARAIGCVIGRFQRQGNAPPSANG